MVTGASGLLGRHIIKFLAPDHTVIAVVHTLPSEPIKGVEYLVIDLSILGNFDLLPKSIDAIFHLAQSNRFREFPQQSLNIFNINVGSTAYLLEYARLSSAQHFILTSSGGVYGNSDNAFKENFNIEYRGELGYYLGSKLCAEILAQNYTPFMAVSVMRIFFMFGKGQNRSMLLPRLVDNIVNDIPIELQGENGICINPVHVADVVFALERCLKTKVSRTINLAGTEVLSLRDIAVKIGNMVGKQPKFKISASAPRHLIANIDLLCEQLYRPQIKFDDGIRDLIG